LPTAVITAEIDDGAALSAVVESKRRHLFSRGTHGREALPARVAGGGFDLDHLGAEVGQKGTGRGGGHPAAELHDAKPLECREARPLVTSSLHIFSRLIASMNPFEPPLPHQRGLNRIHAGYQSGEDMKRTRDERSGGSGL